MLLVQIPHTFSCLFKPHKNLSAATNSSCGAELKKYDEEETVGSCRLEQTAAHVNEWG